MRYFGLIGYPLEHSFSRDYFRQKFRSENIKNAVYNLYPIPRIEELPALLKREPGLKGLNVTIPYKEKVIAYCANLDSVAAVISAVNCLVIRSGRITGYNTDHTGFVRAIQPFLQPHHTAALILGSGGASKAVAFGLRQLNIPYAIVSSSGKGDLAYPELTKPVIEAYPVIINTTPLGMYPNVAQFPPIPYQYLGSRHLLMDLIYNPAETRFMQMGRQQGAVVLNGMEMLKIQAEESWKIWNQD